MTLHDVSADIGFFGATRNRQALFVDQLPPLHVNSIESHDNTRVFILLYHSLVRCLHPVPTLATDSTWFGASAVFACHSMGACLNTPREETSLQIGGRSMALSLLLYHV